MANRRILCVDDDERILRGIERQQGDEFEIEIAVGPFDALKVIEDKGPFAVVLSDMRMPEMNGVELLSKVREMTPDTVRMILTGYAELETTIQAVNEGHIFRFLSKPCEGEDLALAFQSALRQYALVEAEKELVEETLRGSIKVLSEVLSLVNPLAFGQTARVKTTVQGMLKRLDIQNAWQVEIASMLSSLGCVALPKDLLERKLNGDAVTFEEQALFNGHPSIASELLRTIPRLERVAETIECQNIPLTAKERDAETLPLESKILHLAMDFDLAEMKAESSLHALAEIKKQAERYDAKLLDALIDYVKEERNVTFANLMLHEIREGMVLAQDIRNNSGTLLMSKGQEITRSASRLIGNIASSKSIEEPVKVVISMSEDAVNTLLHA